jgi:hypothetical protein
MFSQSFMTACIRTAGLRLQSTDKAVGYDPCAVCLRYMNEAKIQVGHVPMYDFSYLIQLINTLGRRMNTMMINSLWMHMEKRQYRAIKESIQAAFTESSLPMATFRKSDDEKKVHCATDRKTILKSIHHLNKSYGRSRAPLTLLCANPTPKTIRKTHPSCRTSSFPSVRKLSYRT